jgi:ketosteroid isomerase-like protein
MSCAPTLIILIALSQNPSVPVSDVSELSRLESEWNQAHVRGDAKVLDGLWADDLVVTVPKMPRFNKSQSLQIWRSGRMKFKNYDTSGVQIRVYGNSAIVTGQLRRTRVLGGRTLNDDWQFTKTYVRGPKGWQVVAFHASDAPQNSSRK